MLEYFVDTKVVSKVINGCLQLEQEFGVLLGFLSTPAYSTIDHISITSNHCPLILLTLLANSCY